MMVLLAVCAAFISMALRVPPEGRDLGYYVTGMVLLVGIGLLATGRRDE